MREIRPLLAILSPRDIPWVKEKFDRIDYIDKVWFKYTPSHITYQNIEKYFREHKEYTHLIINSDDAAPDYNHIAMLIADVKKYNFPVICGCNPIDLLSGDDFLNLTFDIVIRKEIPIIARYCRDNHYRGMYHHLPKEFLELKGIVRVWFEGGGCAVVRRDILEKVGLAWGKETSDTSLAWTRHGDLGFSYNCWRLGIPQYADLRVYFDHYRYPNEGIYKIWVGQKEPKVIFEKRKRLMLKATAGRMIRTIPERYVNLMKNLYLEREEFPEYRLMEGQVRKLRMIWKPYDDLFIGEPPYDLELADKIFREQVNPKLEKLT